MIEIIDGNKLNSRFHDIAVLIDVFRATSSILVMLKKGVSYIVPAATVEEAYALSQKYKNAILAGEKDGIKVPEFEFGNSPVEYNAHDLKDKIIIFVSTNGTRVLQNIRAEKVYFASFLNAYAVSQKLKNESDVALIAANRKDLYSVEDFKCAEYIVSLINKDNVDYDQIKNDILSSESADRLRELDAEEDMLFCLKNNIIDFVPIYKGGVIYKNE
ncbi:MAG: 2-phosphosulfolactate phosphatase [Thermoplasmata archaeon]